MSKCCQCVSRAQTTTPLPSTTTTGQATGSTATTPAQGTTSSPSATTTGQAPGSTATTPVQGTTPSPTATTTGQAPGSTATTPVRGTTIAPSCTDGETKELNECYNTVCVNGVRELVLACNKVCSANVSSNNSLFVRLHKPLSNICAYI